MKILLFVTPFLFSCAKSSEDSEGGGRLANSILFVGTDASFDSSALYSFDREERQFHSELPGQSGDVILHADRNVAFLFNRASNNLNFRKLTIDDDKLQIGTQHALPAEMSGDPHGVLLLDDAHLLMLGYNAHALYVVNPDSGDVVQTLKPDLELPGGGPFRPEHVVALREDRLLISHQGYSADWTTTSPGVLIELTWSGATLEVVDANPDQDGIQAIELVAHLPQSLVTLPDGSIVSVGLCFPNMTDCVSAIETFDPNTGQVTEQELPTIAALHANGSTTPIGDSTLVIQTANANQDAQLTKVDLSSDQVTTILDYQSFSVGLVLYDKTSTELIVAEPVDDKTGKFSSYIDDKIGETIPTPAIARQGVFVRGSQFDR